MRRYSLYPTHTVLENISVFRAAIPATSVDSLCPVEPFLRVHRNAVSHGGIQWAIVGKCMVQFIAHPSEFKPVLDEGARFPEASVNP